MRGTGGFRKFRYAGVKSRGKSGGLRVIHLYVANHGEVHLIDIFEKSDKDNLTKAEQNELAKIAALLKESLIESEIPCGTGMCRQNQ